MFGRFNIFSDLCKPKQKGGSRTAKAVGIERMAGSWG